MIRIAKYLLFVLVLTLSLGLGAAWFMPSNNDKTVVVHVPSGGTLYQLSETWQKDGWLPSAWLLRTYARIFFSDQVLKIGEYKIPPHISVHEFLTYLPVADRVTYRITFIEGKTLQDAFDKIANTPELTQNLTPLTYERFKAFFKLQGYPEGLIYPDTYEFERGELVTNVLRRAHERLLTKLDNAWQKRQHDHLPYKTPQEALIMASIVEKETGAAYERPHIAKVFINRLRKGMRLETDPTVIYGAKRFDDGFDGNLKRRHLANRDNPYNTYRHRGLPPSPIALVGEAALKAALNPSDTDALYFVAKGDGSHQFSQTLEQHNNAVRKYQKRRRKDYRSSPAPEATTTE